MHGGVTPTMALIIKVVVRDRVDDHSGQLAFIDDVSLQLKSAVQTIFIDNGKYVNNLNDIFYAEELYSFVLIAYFYQANGNYAHTRFN